MEESQEQPKNLKTINYDQEIRQDEKRQIRDKLENILDRADAVANERESFEDGADDLYDSVKKLITELGGKE